MSTTVDRVTAPVNGPRQYRSAMRAEQAAATRHRLLSAGWTLFTEQGYAATTVTEVARAAGTSVDTLYATIGRKPVLMRAVVESAISGTDQTIPALQRGYVQRVRAAPTAAEKLELYAAAIAEMSPRTAPIFLALRDAAQTDAECDALGAEISSRRASNMRDFAAELRETGELRDGLTDDAVGDIIWATAGAEHYAQLVLGRGWTPAQFGDYLRELWSSLFLARRDIRPPS